MNNIRKLYAIIRDCGDGSGTIDLVSSKILAKYLMSEERAEMLKDYEYYLSEGSYLEIPTVGVEEHEILKPTDLTDEDFECFKTYALNNQEGADEA